MRSQRITPMDAVGPAQRMLNDASIQKNIGAMNSGVPPMANMDDGGAYTKPYVEDHQTFQQQQYAAQDVVANTMTQRPQLAAHAAGDMRRQFTEQSGHDEKKKQFLNSKLADTIYNTSGGGDMMRFNAVAGNGGPEAKKFYHNMAVSNAMYGGHDPALGELKATAGQYMA